MLLTVRSWLAAGWASALGTPEVRVVAPTESPSDAVADVMAEVGIDLRRFVSVATGEAPGVRLDDVDPDTSSLSALRSARDALLPRVDALLRQHDSRASFGGDETRDRFALASDITFLNHGSFGATPRVVLRAQRRWQDELEAQPVRFMLAVGERVRGVAHRLATFLGASPDDLVLVDNATSGVNAVLRSLAFGPGDTIVTTSLVYGAVARTLEHVAKTTGARIVTVDIPFPLESPDQVVDAVRRAWPQGARLAVFDHLTSATGLVYPIRELIELAHAQGVPVLVDGAHVPGHVPVDLTALGAEFWVGNAHKWLFSPKGCAVLHVDARYHEQVHPGVISHGYGQGLAAEFEWQGTRDPSPWLAAAAALDFAEEIGIDRIRAHNVLLRARGARILLDRLGGEAPAPPQMLAALQTLPLPTDAPGTMEAAWELNGRLWERHRIEAMIVPVHGRLWVRIAAQIYNAPQDYERLAVALETELGPT